ncbi:cytochrome c5 family protein [Spongiibacter sp. KMU-166]|uniref:Cytochrome c5 family protein n=1 Tax=Spongiibacter thalassae TaxID=2721624 RepID=A0ABX1GBA0_9GAMM|nr:c-type cytochrome [Spongiibacter thalassae]NKI16226.1 cytochrome c5 family protein [Spongiibacter thalassae]
MKGISVITLVLATVLSGCAEDPRLALGEEVYRQNCKVCHAQGINGAPILGNSKMWGPRLGQSHEELLSHALSGYGLMPAKGGKTHLTDEQVSNAIFYMTSQVEISN